MAGIGGYPGDECGQSSAEESGKDRVEGIDKAWCAKMVVPVTMSELLDVLRMVGTNQILHDPEILPQQGLSKKAYMNKNEKQSSINHFHEKLFKLKDLMKTKAGKRRAEKRHKFMLDFVGEFYEEWSGRA